MRTNRVARAALAAGLSGLTVAQNCPRVLVPSYNFPNVNSGWQVQLVLGGLTKPRSIEFDSTGALLVVESGKGITRHRFSDDGGTCLTETDSTVLISQTSLNHGLAFSNDGRTLYASTAEAVYAWQYDATQGVSAVPRAIVTGMANDDLVTRTLLMSKKSPGTLVISRGSAEAKMAQAALLSSGLSQVRAFDLTNFTATSKAYNFNTDGVVLGWGLRNSVGIGEHPVTGGIYGVENSVDGVTRNGKDIHENNPGEELNYFGVLGTDSIEGKNYGYPHCFAVWDVAEIPENDGLSVGDQFAIQENNTLTDETCAREYVPPRLTFPAHYAPLDIKFNERGDEAFVSFHGSFDKSDPVGYSVAVIPFDTRTGEPTGAHDHHDVFQEIMTNPDHTKCPGNCFRPAGLAFDAAGRLWMTSDTTGEIYVLQKKAGTPSTTASGTIVTATGRPSGAGTNWGVETKVLALAGVVLGGLFVVL
ncbi:soluble quino protein glucose/sorbosone dehydrogenase [Podospora aff. communis PSN243]|uniref:Soluble quino protein glucose/sorbosone dehydrogenase n=1 Tax=Podospora aff. communis PSN243 TaxID=3040156 RepID=A0AAV9G115_9PEZI|nr:soluble quino protein glucose/sorbosone dehydrogenase [Podospora aff. communis PSN243]